MAALTPKDKPEVNIAALVARLAQHEVRWVMCGSCVLQMYGARLTPNDLDVVPALAPDNLRRLAICLENMAPVPALFDGWTHPRNTANASATWRPWPATAENLDWLYVTQWGRLDIVIENAEPYPELLSDATGITIDGVTVNVCTPQRVLQALETRKRQKDVARKAEYDRLRRQFGLPVSPSDVDQSHSER